MILQNEMLSVLRAGSCFLWQKQLAEYNEGCIALGEVRVVEVKVRAEETGQVKAAEKKVNLKAAREKVKQESASKPPQILR